MNRYKSRSFTLVEMVVVVGILGLIVGGLMLSMRQIIQEEAVFKKMQETEEQARFIASLFSLDAGYSELDLSGNPVPDVPGNKMTFLLAEKSSDLSAGISSATVTYSSEGSDAAGWYLEKKTEREGKADETVTLNTVPLDSRPLFVYKVIKDPGGDLENYFITASLVFRITVGSQVSRVPIETSTMSRTFEF